MTKEEKILWLRNASNEDVLKQLCSSMRVISSSSSSIADQIEAEEDYQLAMKESLSRMTK